LIYLEDLVVGSVIDLGTVVARREELLAFSTRFDPQPIHLDATSELARQHGDIIASGWHTGAMWMRLYVDGFVRDLANLGGLGVEQMQFPRAVKPDDRLNGYAEVLEVRPSERKLDRGTVTTRGTMRNQRTETVFVQVSRARVLKRPVA
jgi:acyl dehydratase